MSFGTDRQLMYFMSNRFLKDKIYGVCVRQFKIACISNTTHSSHKTLVKFCRGVHYMWWLNQEF